MLYYFERFLRFTLEILAASLCLAGTLERKPTFRLQLGLTAAASAIGCALLAFLAADQHMGVNDTLSKGVYFFLVLLSIGSFFVLYRGTFLYRIFFCMNGIMLRMFSRKIYDICKLLNTLAGGNPALFQSSTWSHYVIYYAIMICAFLIAGHTLGKAFRSGWKFTLPGRIVGVYAVMLAINLLLSGIEPQLESVSGSALLVLLICEMAYYGLILAVQWFFYQMAQTEVEAAAARELLRQDQRQYEQMKDTIEVINIKCHDLRHHIREIQRSVPGDTGYLSEVSESIAIYDSMIKTGNEVLDVILTDKRLRCESQRIQLTVMADGVLLNPMSQTEIYALFGNLLDNAMEHVSGIPDEDKRFISLSVRSSMGLVNIHVENYYEGEALREDQLPATTKADSSAHGFGLRSVKRIVDKYEGTLQLLARDGMFQVNILLPLPPESD